MHCDQLEVANVNMSLNLYMLEFLVALTLVLPRGMVTTPWWFVSGHLGHLVYIICGHFNEKTNKQAYKDTNKQKQNQKRGVPPKVGVG